MGLKLPGRVNAKAIGAQAVAAGGARMLVGLLENFAGDERAKLVALLKAEYDGENPAYRCDCADCWGQFADDILNGDFDA